MQVRVERERIRVGRTWLRVRDIRKVAVFAEAGRRFSWANPGIRRRRVRRQQAIAAAWAVPGCLVVALTGYPDLAVLLGLGVLPGVLAWIDTRARAPADHLRLSPQHLLAIMSADGSVLYLATPDWDDAVEFARAVSSPVAAVLLEPFTVTVRAWPVDRVAPISPAPVGFPASTWG